MGGWLVRRAETVLLTATVGLVFVVSGIFVYSAYVDRPEIGFGIANFVLFHAGFATIWGAGRQFLTGRLPLPGIAIRAVAAMTFSIVPLILGYDGLAFIADNLAIALLLFATARQYWLARAEAPAPILGITALYTLTGISFVLCAAVLISDGKLVLGKAPSNWAEDLSLAVCIAGMFKFIDAVRAAGGIVDHGIALFFYGIFGQQRFDDGKVRLHHIATWRNVLAVAKERQLFDDKTLEEVEAFLDAPLAWSGRNGGVSELSL